jgi:hypothetical protein
MEKEAILIVQEIFNFLIEIVQGPLDRTIEQQDIHDGKLSFFKIRSTDTKEKELKFL